MLTSITTSVKKPMPKINRNDYEENVVDTDADADADADYCQSRSNAEANSDANANEDVN